MWHTRYNLPSHHRTLWQPFNDNWPPHEACGGLPWGTTVLVVPYTAGWLFTLFLDISIRKPSGFQLSNNPSCSSVPTSRMDSILNMATVGNYSTCLVSNSKRFPSGPLHHTLMLFPLKISYSQFSSTGYWEFSTFYPAQRDVQCKIIPERKEKMLPWHSLVVYFIISICTLSQSLFTSFILSARVI